MVRTNQNLSPLTYAKALYGVEDQGHGLDGVGVDDWLEHQPLLKAVVTLKILLFYLTFICIAQKKGYEERAIGVH